MSLVHPSPSQSLPVPPGCCSGRKEERWEPADCGQVLPSAPEQQQRLAADAMFRLEHGVSDRGVLERAAPALTRLQEAQSAWKDDFGLNSRLRRRFRVSGAQIPRKRPEYTQKRPKYTQNHPEYTRKRPEYTQKHPKIHRKHPKYTQK
ncbi:coiled-coil domain-containing protein 130-like, partial [Onychostruthus taczanowskii]|uniref:coiled-coil domain-containing protein 130-like n=1 Tax=Onychostruthus taczanowskii TaxID=356909 RepID=UPI001B803DE1